MSRSRAFVRLAFLATIFPAACAEDPSLNQDALGPCPGEAGFGARVAVAEGPVDVCAPDDSVATVFTLDGWYDATARATDENGTVYEFRMVFPHRPSARALNITGNLAEARADPDGAWFSYRELPQAGGGVESVLVRSGSFRLGYSDTEVVAGLFEGVELEMVSLDSGEAAGSRTIVEGFFSILTDEMPGDRSY
jgi:hypothetical protein